MKPIRHAADIFDHSCRLIKPRSVGLYSKEEDQIILEEVAKCGETLETWKNLASKLERSYPSTIKRRYILLTHGKTFYQGRWNSTEDKILIEALFHGKVGDICTIESIDFNDLKKVAETLNRPWDSVNQRWNVNLKPVLLSHHNGTLHKPWRVDLFNYVVEKKVVGEQDLDFAELKLLFPEQTRMSIHLTLVSLRQKTGVAKKPLYEHIKDLIPNYKDHQDSERLKTFREEIVRIYDRVVNGDK